ncbi:MAG: hypothetical protein PSV16_11015 [Flavobacterium sp.]|nr:hypothetical protein [Flavobacterium sp.]
MVKNKWFRYFIIVLKVLLCGVLLYVFRWLSVQFCLTFFKPLIHLPENASINIKQQWSVLLEVAIEVALTCYAVMVFQIAQRFIKIDNVFLLAILVSPLLFEVSNVFRDRSCMDPWLHWHKLVWYLAIKSLWVFVCLWLLIKLKMRCNGQKDYVVIACGFLVYHILKTGLAWNV